MEASEPPAEPSMLGKLRNTWEFANLMQYIFIFGKAVKIDEDFDIEDLERECLKPEPSTALSEIGLALLKFVSSHRGLTLEIFDEYTRRQFMAKAPHRNPFGEDEEPNQFAGFDVFTKLKVLVQLSQWTLNNPDRIREKMEERTESEQSVAWRMNEIGYDRHDRYYFVLDDNRLYRRTEAPVEPPPAPKPKASSKKAKAAARSSKKNRTREAEESANDADIETPQPEEDRKEVKERGNHDGFGGRTWECVAITLIQYRDFLESIRKSRDPDEKALYKRITDEVMPIIEQAEVSQLRKKQRRERELLNMQKLATAKRSSRLEAKMERERQEREEREAEQKRNADLAEARAYEKKQQKMEEDRESRMMTREQRLKERELKRILHEEELARMSEEEKKVDAGESRVSERHLKAEMEKKKKELAALEEDVWAFDCSKCGVHGENLDDGTHSVACEKCNVWQHSACLGISQPEAERDDFHFICHDCKRREEDAKKPKIPSLKFRLGSSTSPQEHRVVIPAANEGRKRKSDDDGAQSSTKKAKRTDHQEQFNIQLSPPLHNLQNGVHATVMNGPKLSSDGQLPRTSSQALYAGNQHSTTVQHSSRMQSPSAPAYTNGPGRHPTQTNGYEAQAPNQSFQPPPFVGNGYRQGKGFPQQGSYQVFQGGYKSQTPHTCQTQSSPHRPQQPPGWSARYVPPSQSQPQHHRPSTHGPPPANKNPFDNTLDDNRPSSHWPASSQGSNNVTALSPERNGPSTAPTVQQYQTPSPSFAAQPPSPSTTHPVNGYPSNTALFNSQLVGPPSQSPVKHPSPPSSNTAPSPQPSSSPVAYQPTLQANAPTSPGFSPVKQSPPQQQAAPPGYGVPGNANVLRSVTKLAPSPTQQSLTPPVRVVISDNPVQAQAIEKHDGQA